MKPARVLHVIGGLGAGGAEALIMNAFRHIDRRRCHFDVAVAAADPCHYDEEFRELGGRIFRHPAPGRDLRGFLAAFGRTLEQGGPYQAVHSHVHHFSGVVLWMARRAGVPVRLAHSHSTRDGQINGPARRAYRWAMRRLILGCATHLAGASLAAARALFGDQADRDPRFSVLPNAIELDPYRGLDEGGTPPEAGLAIGHVGRFEQPKNHAFLLEVMVEVVRRMPEARLMLVGGGRLQAEVEERVRRLGIRERVSLLGVRRDVPELLAKMHVFAFPSLYEGLGMAVVEAQAAGLNCVVSPAVPQEADLGLGLFHRTPLEAGAAEWARRLVESAEKPRPAWSVRERVLAQAGYDIRSTAALMERVYAGDRN